MTNRTMRDADTRKKQTQIIINLRHRRHSWAWVAWSRFLINRNCRRKARNHIDIRFIHHAKEHARIARKRLDVATLTFGINRIKSEGRLTRTRKSRNHDQLIARDINIDILEVIRACAANSDIVSIHKRLLYQKSAKKSICLRLTILLTYDI